MTEVENIMSAIIVMFVLLIGGLVYMTRSAHDSVYVEGVKVEVFTNDAYTNNLNNILKITEPKSGRSMGILLSDAVYYRNETLAFNNQTINVTSEAEKLLNISFGTNKYYLIVKPRIIEVSLNFIIDGSPSLDPERKLLATYLPEILDKIEQKLNETNEGYAVKLAPKPVIANVYILAEKSEMCDIYTRNLSDSRISCQVLGQKKLYLRNASINTSDIFLNMSQYNLDAFLNYYNMTPPFGFAWNNAYQYAQEYALSDWGYGTGYASNFDQKTTLSRLTILFPMGDDLSTTSIADVCFNASIYTTWVTCSLCRDECAVNRSLRSVEKGIQVAKDNNHVINPIFSYSCDYDYQPFFTDIYNQIFRPSTNVSNACGAPRCAGCSLNGTDVCFHPNCRGAIVDQMELMANQTGGRMIDLQDIATMDLDISNTIRQNIDQYAIEIGEMRPELERDVIETTQPLPNGQLVDVRLWVYRNPKIYK